MTNIRNSIAMMVVMLFTMASYGLCQEAGTAGDAKILTLKDAVRIAHVNNKPIQIQEQNVVFARANIMDAQSKFLPTIDIGYGYTLNGAVAPVVPTGASRIVQQVFTGYKNDNLIKLSAKETVYNGGADIANYESARVELKVQRETLRAAKLEVEFEVKRLFYGLLLAYETERIARELVDNAKAHRDVVKSKYEQGTASKFDFLRSEVHVSNMMPQLIKARNDVELIGAELKKTLSMEQRQPIGIDGRLEYLPIEIKEEEFLIEAYRRNPEMILKLLGIDISKWEIEFARAGWLPQINATANYYYRSGNVNDMVNPMHNNWNIGMTASLAIFDGFATKAKVDEARAKYAKTNLQKENFADQLALDIKSACLDMVKAKSVIESQQDSVVEAKEALRISEVGYDNGVITNLDVFDTQVSLAQVETDLAQGIYDYIVANAAADRLMGIEFN